MDIFLSGVYREGNHPFPIQSRIDDSDGSVIFQTDSFKPKDNDVDSELWVYYTDDDGVSLSIENKLIHTFKATSPPSFYETFELFMEDCNGVMALSSILSWMR